MKSVIYLHGFNSSPESQKAQMTKRYFAENAPDINLYIPKLPPQPRKAIAIVRELVDTIDRDDLIGFIGSSLGGYYAIYLSSILSFGAKTVLINPAIRPFELLQDYLGVNENYYTGERYEVLPEHMLELKDLFVERSRLALYINHHNALLLAQVGDEVLDYSLATAHLAGAKMWIGAGGDHAFQGYDQVLPAILNFLKYE